jgi:hypothetical protein
MSKICWWPTIPKKKVDEPFSIFLVVPNCSSVSSFGMQGVVQILEPVCIWWGTKIKEKIVTIFFSHVSQMYSKKKTVEKKK